MARPVTKLSRDQAVWVYFRYKMQGNISMKDLGKRFGISQQHAARIIDNFLCPVITTKRSTKPSEGIDTTHSRKS